MGIEPNPLELAARALQHRDRSAREIDERLARAGLGDDARAEALETLERIGYVDDARFAAARADALAARGHGDAAIRHDLEGHGVPANVIETVTMRLEPESERARAIAERHGRSGDEAIEAALGGDVAAGGPEFL